MGLKANELRIGNYLNTINGIKRVSDISVDRYCWFTDNQCEPIPLTEEWLLKFGFKYNGWNYEFERFIFHAQGTNDDNEFYNTEFYCVRNEEKCLISFKIQFVHQLQNLYFALTNEELEIKM